ncbi:MAG: SDR family NAD(P)-dependent oxidoreductase [Acidimicrobiales bacterium]
MTGSISYSPLTGVIITGGGSGIGAATMHSLAEAGRPVAAWDLNGDNALRVAEEVRQKYGVAALGLALDVTDTASFASAITSTRDALGTIGGLVHCAGIPGVSTIDELDESVWALTLSTHLTAAALLIRDLTPDLKANPGSASVFIASIAAIVGFDANPAYCAAKSGLLGLARSTAARLGEHGIRANSVCPGFIDTPMMARSLQSGADRFATRSPLRRLGQPDDIATAVRFLLSDDASFVTGTEIVVDGGVTRTVF